MNSLVPRRLLTHTAGSADVVEPPLLQINRDRNHSSVACDPIRIFLKKCGKRITRLLCLPQPDITGRENLRGATLHRLDHFYAIVIVTPKIGGPRQSRDIVVRPEGWPFRLLPDRFLGP